MFKKLRRRFVVLIMCISGTILLSVFLFHTILNYFQLIEANYKMLRNVAYRDVSDDFAENEIDEIRDEFTPYFSNAIMKVSAWYDDENHLNLQRNNAYHLKIEDEYLLDIANTIMLSQSSVGYIKKYNIRFFKTGEDIAGKTTLAFCTCDMEQAYTSKLFGMSTLSFFCGLIVIFIISIFVSKALIKPTETAWQKQQQFIANASHELKTPLSVIMANNKILLSNINDKISDRKKWIINSEAEAEQMKKLLEQMLYLAKSDTNPYGKDDLKIIDLSDEITLSALSFDALAFERNINIEISVCEGIKVFANLDDIKNVISTLLDNAIKYSDKNQTVSVTLKKVKGKAELCVRNFGAIIDESDIPYIFDRFYRVDKSRSKSVDGFGLGLSIAQKAVHNAKGTIKCESNQKNGTSFTVMLPISE